MEIKQNKLLFGILFATLLAVLVGNCSSGNKVAALEKQLHAQDSVLKVVAARPENVAPLTAEELKKIVKATNGKLMYDYLIYEQALDDKSVTLAQIKVREKIED